MRQGPVLAGKEAELAFMREWLAAWNRADAAGVAAFYGEPFDYRDPNVPEGIRDRDEFLRYLKVLFHKFPMQEWVVDEVLPHAKASGYTVCYHYRYANARSSVQGTGIDRIELAGGKIALNWVYLNPSPQGKNPAVGPS